MFKVQHTQLKRIGASLFIFAVVVIPGVTSASNGQCNRASPTVTISPSTQMGLPGQQINYQILVTNNDSLACGVSTFRILPTFADPGFQQSPSFFRLTLLPGQTGIRNVVIRSSPTACVGPKTFRETAINEAVPDSSGFAEAVLDALRLVPDCGRAEPTVSTTPEKQGALAGEQLIYLVTIKNNDNPACGGSEFIVKPALQSGLTNHTPREFVVFVPVGGTASRVVIVRSDLFAIGDLVFTETATHGCATCLMGSAPGIFSITGNVVPIRYCCSSKSSDGGATAGNAKYTGCTVITDNTGGCVVGVAVECTQGHTATPNPPGSGKYDLSGNCFGG